MPKATLEAGKPVGDIIPDDTWLLAELSAVTTKDIPRKDGTVWTKWVWKFIIIEEGEYESRVVWGETDGTFFMQAENVCFQWVGELYGTELAEGFELDTDDLLTKTARINIGVREYTKGGELRQLNEVVNLLRAKQPANAEPF